MKYSVVNKPNPSTSRREPGFWREFVRQVEKLPANKALAIPMSEVKSAGSFRGCVATAAARIGIAVKIRKGDGVYLVSRREREEG